GGGVGRPGTAGASIPREVAHIALVVGADRACPRALGITAAAEARAAVAVGGAGRAERTETDIQGQVARRLGRTIDRRGIAPAAAADQVGPVRIGLLACRRRI